MTKKEASEPAPRRGRPHKHSLQPHTYSPGDLLRHQLLKYLASIGFDHGFIMNDKQRSQLKHQQATEVGLPRIDWDSEHTWHRKEQAFKINQVLEQYGLQGRDQLLTELLKVGDIFAREFTREVYRFVVECHELAKGRKEEAERGMESLMGSVLREYTFLPCKFSRERSCTHIERLAPALCKLIRRTVNILAKNF